MSEWWVDAGFLALLGLALAVLSAVVGGFLFLWKWARSHHLLHAKLEELPGKVDDVNARVAALLAIELDRTPNLWDKVKAFSPKKTNPYDPIRKNILMDKMRAGTVNLTEARELESILKDDLDRAKAEGATIGAGVIVAILAVLGAVGALIYLLTRKD